MQPGTQVRPTLIQSLPVDQMAVIAHILPHQHTLYVCTCVHVCPAVWREKPETSPAAFNSNPLGMKKAMATFYIAMIIKLKYVYFTSFDRFLLIKVLMIISGTYFYTGLYPVYMTGKILHGTRNNLPKQ